MTETQAQQECEYCHEPYKRIKSEFENFLTVSNGGIRMAYCYSKYRVKKYVTDDFNVNFCPMCGRKLDEDND